MGMNWQTTGQRAPRVMGMMTRSEVACYLPTSERFLARSRCPKEQRRRQEGKQGQPKVKELNISFGDLGSNPHTAAHFPEPLFKSLIPTLVKNSH